MKDCIFCKIISGEFSSMKVYEDEHTLAFMDVAKDVDGHILVVPKKHVNNILDCDNENISIVMNTVKKVSNYLVNECGYEGVNFLNASGISAGQSITHFHIHIIPRKTNDGLETWPKLPGAKYEIEEVYKKIMKR